MRKINIVVLGFFIAMALAVSTSAQMPGDTVGYTQYDYQSLGACGNRIALDGSSNVHVTWMKGVNNNATRHIYYNSKSSDYWYWPGTGTQVSLSSGAGFASIGLFSDRRAAIFYHRATTSNESLYVAIDAAPSQGFFDTHSIPNRLTSTHRYIWPCGVVDISNRLHLVAIYDNPTSGGPLDFVYTRSTNEGVSWIPIQVVDTIRTISPIIVASPISNKMAIVYPHAVDTTSQRKNDIYYISSSDGANWSWANKINVTEYGIGDSLFAYADLDAIIDYSDHLHIIWVAGRVTSSGEPVGPVYLYHYTDDMGSIVEVTHLDAHIGDSCDVGGWNYPINKMSLAASTEGDLYTVYARFDGADCSDDGEANGELIAQASYDGGNTWGLPINITNTPSPDCVAPNCRSEIYPSIAERADDYLHIFYLGYTGSDYTYGYPVLYYAYPVVQLGTMETSDIPQTFSLSQNYPNPFNAVTAIPFELGEKASVELSVFDISGKEIAKLYSGVMDPGPHRLFWHAGHLPSGVYFARLSVGEESISTRMVLVK